MSTAAASGSANKAERLHLLDKDATARPAPIDLWPAPPRPVPQALSMLFDRRRRVFGLVPEWH
jgi:hypothetical protein